MHSDQTFRITVKWLVDEQVRTEGLSTLHSARQWKHKLVLTQPRRQAEHGFLNAVCNRGFSFLSLAIRNYSI